MGFQTPTGIATMHNDMNETDTCCVERKKPDVKG